MTTASAVDQKIERARAKFFRDLPKRLECPCCGQSRKKESFGVRLVNREAVVKQGNAPQFFRQSHCNTCRG